MLRRSAVPWILASFCLNQIVNAQTLAEKIDALINKNLPHATVGILVKDIQTGEIIYKKNADKLLSPASNIKMFTAAAALFHLGPDHYFSTVLAQKDQNFYIKFGGSPSLTINNFNKLLENLKKNNPIKGDIILDTSLFKAPNYAGGVTYDDLGWGYSPPETAVMLNENAENYQLISAKELGKPATLKSKNPNNRLTLINEVITVSKEQEKDHCNFNIEILPKNTLRLFGCMAQYKAPKELQLAIPDPVFLTQQLIKKYLEQNNIVFKGQIIEGVMPSDAQVIATYYSKNVGKLVTRMLRESDNLYANTLAKQLAVSLTKESSYKQAAFAIKTILKEHTNLNMSQVEITDGAGARYNLVTPQQIVLLLTNLYNDKALRPVFLNALPQAGVSGSLKARMKKTLLEKKIFAKTGTMHDISALSGYLINPQGRSLIFSIVINGINKPINVAKSLEEQILLTIVGNIADKPDVENAFG